jgi:hypothetical protein
VLGTKSTFVSRYSVVSSETTSPSRRYHSCRDGTEPGAYTDSSRVPGSGARRRISARTPTLSRIVPQVFVRRIATSKTAARGHRRGVGVDEVPAAIRDAPMRLREVAALMVQSNAKADAVSNQEEMPSGPTAEIHGPCTIPDRRRGR